MVFNATHPQYSDVVDDDDDDLSNTHTLFQAQQKTDVVMTTML